MTFGSKLRAKCKFDNREYPIRKDKLREVVDAFIHDSPDLAYQFYMIGEYYRLKEGDEAGVLSDITNFYLKMTEAIEQEKLVVSQYEMSRPYESAGLDVRMGT